MCIQIKDSIIIKGEKFSLYTCPLDGHWTMRNPKPQIRLISTICWRGYVATWEIFEQQLYLIDIQFHAPEGDFGLEYLFPKNNGNVKAHWFTGELKIPMGNELYEEHMLDSVYDADWHLRIKRGKVISHRYQANY